MIIREEITISEKIFVKTYSDKGLYIRQIETGNEYAEAFDLKDVSYEYEETEKELADIIEPEEPIEEVV